MATSHQKHPKIGSHVNKEFKELERLQGIFGKDRAIRQEAKGVVGAMRNDIGENQVNDDDELLQHDKSHTSTGKTTTRT